MSDERLIAQTNLIGWMLLLIAFTLVFQSMIMAFALSKVDEQNNLIKEQNQILTDLNDSIMENQTVNGSVMLSDASKNQLLEKANELNLMRFCELEKMREGFA